MRRMLGLFVGFPRYWQDVGQFEQARSDYALARSLFPNSRLLRRKAEEIMPAPKPVMRPRFR